MLAKERLLYVIERLNTQPAVSILKLSEDLGVSVSTIQRDLNKLDLQGGIQRERGGAIKIDISDTLSSLTEIPVAQKELINIAAKQLICARAAQVVKDGDCIFIDSGTTPTYLIPFLKEKKIKIVTNSNYLLKKIAKEYRGEVYVLGGKFNLNHDMSLGPITIEQINKFRFDHVFLGASGLDIDSGEVFTVEFDIGAIKSEVMKRSRYKYLLIDDSKYSVNGLCTWANMDEFDKLFVNDFALKKKKPHNMIICK